MYTSPAPGRSITPVELVNLPVGHAQSLLVQLPVGLPAAGLFLLLPNHASLAPPPFSLTPPARLFSTPPISPATPTVFTSRPHPLRPFFASHSISLTLLLRVSFSQSLTVCAPTLSVSLPPLRPLPPSLPPSLPHGSCAGIRACTTPAAAAGGPELRPGPAPRGPRVRALWAQRAPFPLLSLILPLRIELPQTQLWGRRDHPDTRQAWESFPRSVTAFSRLIPLS